MGAHTAKFSEVDFRRHELRAGSGKMWPERNTGEHFKIGRVATEVAAALSHRRHPRAPTPPPAPNWKSVPRRSPWHKGDGQTRYGAGPRKFERRVIKSKKENSC
jgi:hypothetical protein